MGATTSTSNDAADLAAYFDMLRTGRRDTQIRGLSGTCRFDIQSVGSWLLIVNDGHVDARQGNEPAESIVSCTADEFLRAVHGALDAFTAALRGKLRISGDLALIQLLGRIAL